MMGADIYMKWKGMTKKDKDNQITGYNVSCGRYGYLRGAYNGHVGLDAIEMLFDGVDWKKDWKVDIKLLEANLKKLRKTLFIERAKDFYGGKDGKEQQSYKDFVKLARKLHDEGKNPRVSFSY
jgi:hypothetical protein